MKVPMQFTLSQLGDNQVIDTWEKKPDDSTYSTFGQVVNAILDKTGTTVPTPINFINPSALQTQTVESETEFPNVDGVYDFKLEDKTFRLLTKTLDN